VGRTSGWSWQGVCCSAAFAPDGGALVAGKFNGEVLVCRRDGQELSPEPAMLTAHVGQVQGIGALPGCSVVITAGAGGEVRFFDWASRALIRSIHVLGSRLTSLRVSPNGAFMAVGDSDASMSFWDLRVLELPALFTRPLARAVPAHLPAVSAVVQDERLEARVRNGMRFVQCLLQHRFRYDIEVDELPTIRVGEFDIEIE
jgi:WD40 repeat protein